MSSNDPLKNLQLDLAARLDSHPNFAEIPVFSRARGNVSSDIENALGALNSKAPGKVGVVVSVMMPMADVPFANEQGPRFDIISTVLVLENPLLNNTGITAEECAMNVFAALHHLKLHPKIGQINAEKRAMEPFDTGDESVIGYTCYFTCKFGLSPARKLFAPNITGTAAAVTIAVPGIDSDATVYYTTDETFPHSGNPAAEEYTAPFAVDSGTRVRAGAYKTDYTPSDITSATIGA